jgi:Holliday junction resolvase RusA-like endonuclease
MISLSLFGDPIPLKRARSSGSLHYDPQKKEKEQIKWQIRSQFRDNPIASPISLDLIFFMPIPKSTSSIRKKQMINGSIFHCHRPDVDNLAKLILDCLNNIVYLDDSQVIEMKAKKVYSEKPGTLIRIEALSSSNQIHLSTKSENEI